MLVVLLFNRKRRNRTSVFSLSVSNILGGAVVVVVDAAKEDRIIRKRKLFARVTHGSTWEMIKLDSTMCQ